MSYKKCNEVLEGVFRESLSASPEAHVQAPWGVALNGVGRFAAVAAIGHGLIGVARNSKGKFKLYYGAKHAGNWLYEVWPLWKSALVFSLYAAVWFRLLNSGVHAVSLAGMVIMSVLGLIIFGGRALSCTRHYPVASIAGVHGYISGLVPSLLGLAMAVGSALAAYALTKGMKTSGTAEGFYYLGVIGNLKEIGRYFVLALPMVLLVSVIAQTTFNLFSIEAMVDAVIKRPDFNRNLYGAAGVSGLRSVYEDKLGKRGGGNVFAAAVFAALLAGLAFWPLI